MNTPFKARNNNLLFWVQFSFGSFVGQAKKSRFSLCPPSNQMGGNNFLFHTHKKTRKIALKSDLQLTMQGQTSSYIVHRQFPSSLALWSVCDITVERALGSERATILKLVREYVT